MAPLLRIPPEALDEYRILTQVLVETFETRALNARVSPACLQYFRSVIGQSRALASLQSNMARMLPALETVHHIS